MEHTGAECKGEIPDVPVSYGNQFELFERQKDEKQIGVDLMCEPWRVAWRASPELGFCVISPFIVQGVPRRRVVRRKP